MILLSWLGGGLNLSPTIAVWPAVSNGLKRDLAGSSHQVHKNPDRLYVTKSQNSAEAKSHQKSQKVKIHQKSTVTKSRQSPKVKSHQ